MDENTIISKYDRDYSNNHRNVVSSRPYMTIIWVGYANLDALVFVEKILFLFLTLSLSLSFSPTIPLPLSVHILELRILYLSFEYFVLFSCLICLHNAILYVHLCAQVEYSICVCLCCGASLYLCNYNNAINMQKSNKDSGGNKSAVTAPKYVNTLKW